MNDSYNIDRVKWREIKNDVIKNELTSNKVIKKYELNHKQIWFLYDTLLQEKYNHLYKREKLVNPKESDYVYCDYEDFGRGTIVELFSDDLMFVKFDKRPLNTMCSSKLMITIHDDIKRKITRL